MASPPLPLAWALGVRRGKDAEAERLFFVEGVKAVRDALQAGVRARHAFASDDALDGPAGAALRDALRHARVPLAALARRDVERLSHTRSPQGIVLVAERPPEDAGALLAARQALAVYLDGIQDPGNVGAIVRAALALG